MSGETRSTEGLFASLKTLSVTLVGIVQTRLELLGTDIAEARVRLVSILLLSLVALFCLGVGVVLLAILIVVLFWDTHRLAALTGLTVVFLASGAWVGWLTAQKLRNQPRPFEATLAELSRDRKELSSEP